MTRQLGSGSVMTRQVGFGSEINSFVSATLQKWFKSEKIVSCLLLTRVYLVSQERQQFHLEQLRAAEFRARTAAQQQLNRDQPPAVVPT